MINVFNNETEEGKIYISYPMVEAVKHLKKGDESFKVCAVQAKENIHYKSLVSEDTNFQNLTNLSIDDWYFISSQNFRKVNHMFTDSFTIPEYSEYRDHFDQSSLLQSQIKKYIIPSGQVAVLSAFPFFLIDYFGEEIFHQVTLYSQKELEVKN